MIANTTVVIAILAICIDGIFTIAVRKASISDLKYLDVNYIPSFLAKISLTMEGTALIPSIYASTKEKN
jgi:hypothetical protein